MVNLRRPGIFTNYSDILLPELLLGLAPEDKKERSTYVLAMADLLNLGTRSFRFTESQYKAELSRLSQK